MKNAITEGCYFDASRGCYIGVHVQKLAAHWGWKGDYAGVQADGYHDAWDEAEEFMNDKMAPQGFYFGSNENGDWGLWAIEEVCNG